MSKPQKMVVFYYNINISNNLRKETLTLKRFRFWFVLVAFGVLLYTAVNHLGDIWLAITKICDIVSPILIGALMAFVINAPVQWINKEIHMMKFPKPWSEHKMHVVSIMLTLILIAALIVAIIWLVVPNMISSITTAYYALIEDAPALLSLLESYNIDTTQIRDMLFAFDVSKLSSAGTIISSVIGASSKIIGKIFGLLISAILAIYILFDKHNLKKWAIRFAYAFMPNQAHGLFTFYQKLEKSYFDFFTGQCMESCLLGLMMFTAMYIFKIPYAGLIAVLTAIFAAVPYIGAWFACGVGACFIVLDSPTKALMCILIYACVQFVENQFIYPHVVGNKVGLSPLLTLGSVIVGGSMFGIIGMIFFIPFVAVLRDICSETINKLDEENGYTEEMESYYLTNRFLRPKAPKPKEQKTE